MKISSETAEWIAYAERDLASAKFLLKMWPQPLEIICFHCQQAAEKILKAFMVQNEIRVIKTHDLETLLEKCKSVSADFENLASECERLTIYGSPVRYPFAKDDITESEMRTALNDAQKIWDFVKEKLGGASVNDE